MYQIVARQSCLLYLCLFFNCSQHSQLREGPLEGAKGKGKGSNTGPLNQGAKGHVTLHPKDVLPLNSQWSPLNCGVCHQSSLRKPCLSIVWWRREAKLEPRQLSQMCIVNPDSLGLHILEAETGTQSCLLQRASQHWPGYLILQHTPTALLHSSLVIRQKANGTVNFICCFSFVKTQLLKEFPCRNSVRGQERMSPLRRRMLSHVHAP